MNAKAFQTESLPAESNADSEPVRADALEIEVADKLDIDGSLKKFLDGIYGIQKSFTVLMPHISSWIKDEVKKLNAQYSRYCKTDSKTTFSFDIKSPREYSDLIALKRSLAELKAVNYQDVISQSLFTQVFCEFDAYMGGLLKSIYLKKPELLSALDRKISISELRKFGSIEAATTAMLNDEIDNFRRNSYVEQFTLLENRFAITLKKFSEWGEFVELGQRRNLLIHNGGVINEQYKLICKNEGYVFNKGQEAGAKLTIDPEYLSRTLLIMRKVAFMLTHTLWRKVLPEATDSANLSCHETIYDFLQKKMWNTTIELGQFSLHPLNCKNLTDQHRRMRVINTAIAFKFSNKKKECEELLDAQDWSSAYRDFRLAVAVLKEKTDQIWELMRQIGPKGEMIDEVAYRDWPLFSELRLMPEFHTVFEEIYGETFVQQAHDSTITTTSPTKASPVLDSNLVIPVIKNAKKSANRVITRSSTMNPSSIPGSTIKTTRQKKTPATK